MDSISTKYTVLPFTSLELNHKAFHGKLTTEYTNTKVNIKLCTVLY